MLEDPGLTPEELESLESFQLHAMQEEQRYVRPRVGVKYRCFLSKSKGRSRKRKHPVIVELLSFGGGRFMVANPNTADMYLGEALAGICVPPDKNEYEYLLELLRRQ